MEREVGGGIGMGKTCKLKDVSFQCMTKFTTNKKNNNNKKKRKKKKKIRVGRKEVLGLEEQHSGWGGGAGVVRGWSEEPLTKPGEKGDNRGAGRRLD